MKKLVIGMALSALAVPAMAQTRVFDFMGYDTETAKVVTELAGKKCSTEGLETQCSLPWNYRLGDATVNVMMVNFYQGKISSVLGIAERDQFLSLLSVFTAKYGAPTMKTEKWQNRAGASFDNTVAIWKFKDGELELKQIGSRIDNTDVQFFSRVNRAEAKPPVVNL